MSDTSKPAVEYRPRIKRGGEKAVRITISLYPPELEALKKTARDRGVTVSHMVSLSINGELGCDVTALLKQAEQELTTPVTPAFLKFMVAYAETMNHKVTTKDCLEAYKKATGTG